MNNSYLSMDYSFLVEGLSGERMVPVSNMARSRVAYEIPEMNISREFRQFEYGKEPDKKNLPFGELYALNNMPGGRQLIWDNLKIDDNLARQGLELPLAKEVMEVEYDRAQVAKILKDGTEDEVLDMLEFGPYYIAQWVKEEAVNLDSSSRRKFIGDVLKIDIDGLAANLEWAAEDEDSGRLQYGTIQGVLGKQGETTRRRRSSTVNKTQDKSDAPKKATTRRAPKK